MTESQKKQLIRLLKYYFCLVTSIPIIIDFTFTLSHLSNELSFSFHCQHPKLYDIL